MWPFTRKQPRVHDPESHDDAGTVASIKDTSRRHPVTGSEGGDVEIKDNGSEWHTSREGVVHIKGGRRR